MLMTSFLNRFRKSEPSSPKVLPAPAVDIELPLVAPAPAPSVTLTAQQQWERVLSPAAHVWLMKLPSAVRPNHLADIFPRIVNRLALVWRDVELADKVLDDLLVDKRGGRRGFPSEVSAELLRLHAFHERRRGLPATLEAAALGPAWDRYLRASADR